MDFERMLRYCTQLELNNNRTWFHTPENHDLYIAAKQDFTYLVTDLKFRLSEIVTPDLAEKLLFADAKALQYRIPRDMRTNKNKPPYNPRWGADLSGDRHSLLPVGYYIHIQPGNRSLFGTGAWCDNSEQLLRVRTHISEHFDRFLDALVRCGCPLSGDRLKNVPRGFSPDDPAADYLKFKSWFSCRYYPDAQLRSFDAFADSVLETAERMEPLRCFFNEALSGAAAFDFDEED